jgi:hypothetical protein
MRRSYLWGVLVLTIGIAVLLAAVKAHAPSVEDTAIVPTASSTEATTAPAADVQISKETALQRPSGSPVPQTPATATLVFEGIHFPLHAPEGASVKEAMDELVREGGFTYAYKEYTGIGAFVTEIQGRAGTNEYWILYVNGKSADTGISATHIHPGDVIEWKLEKSY